MKDTNRIDNCFVFRIFPSNCSMKKFALIVAGGSGTRMGGDVPKQFLEISGKPIIYHTARAFVEAFDDINIILVFPADYLQTGKTIFLDFVSKQPVQFAVGGVSRFHSVQNGMQLVDNSSVVFVHDAVRCLVSSKLIRSCYEQALIKGSAIPVITVNDSVRVIDNSGTSSPLNRDLLRSVQTPQTFHSKILLLAFQIDYKEKFTDEATVVEAYGLKVTLVEGEENNIKITTPVDLLIAEKIINERS